MNQTKMLFSVLKELFNTISNRVEFIFQYWAQFISSPTHTHKLKAVVFATKDFFVFQASIN